MSSPDRQKYSGVQSRGAALRAASVRAARSVRRAARRRRLRRALTQALVLLFIAQPGLGPLGSMHARAAAFERQAAGPRAAAAAAPAAALFDYAPLAQTLSGVLDSLAGAGRRLFGGARGAGAPQPLVQQAGVASNAYGPRKFTRRRGAPVNEVEHFKLPADFSGTFTLNVQNGEPQGGNRVSSATIRLNGVEIFGPSDFSQNAPALARAVQLRADNTLEVKLASAPDSFVIINVQGTRLDRAAPAVRITAPPDGFTTTDPTVVVSGTAADEGTDPTGVNGVFVNDQPAVYNAQSGTWSIANVALAVGANRITARAFDRAGNQSSAEITVTRTEPARDTTRPLVAVTSPADGFVTQAAEVAVSGTASDPEPNASGVAQVSVNGREAKRDVLAGTWTVADLPLALGPNRITATATDKAGNVSTHVINVTRNEAPPADAQPPSVAVTSPAEGAVVFTSTVEVRGTAADEGATATGVARVLVNGTEAVYDAGNRAWVAPAVPLAEGENLIVVEAEDAATPPNKARAELHVTRRTVAAPRLTIDNPATGAVLSSAALTVAGEVTSGASDIPVTVRVNGEAANVAGGRYTKLVQLAEGGNTVTVTATDSLGQTAQASVSVISDPKAPTVSLSDVPAVVRPGGTYRIRAAASDNVGVEAVDFAVDEQTVTSVLSAPYEFDLAIPADAPPDRLISITAVARDLTGATAVDTVRTRVAGPSGVSGYVFDDATGYPVAGASATSAEGSVTTSEAGVYSFVSSTPQGLVRVSKEGYTAVERSYEGASGTGTALFDARLTRLDSNANLVAPAGGVAGGDGGRLKVAFDPGVFNAETDVRVTSVGPQGLANLLPFGWSPVPGAVVDVRAAGAAGAFATPARLTIAENKGLSADAQLVLARYDEPRHVWVVLSAPVSAGAGGALSAELPSAGQYAFLVADAGATAPPPPAAGQPLPSAAPAQPSALDSATATAAASPRTAVMSKDARSTILVVAKSPTKLPSGVSVEVTFEETYNLLTDADPLLVDRPTQDFVLYAFPAASAAEPNRLGAAFIAKPTREELTVAQLRSANVHVVIRSGREATTGALIGSAGGTVTADGGAELVIGAGALGASTPVFLSPVADAQSEAGLPAGFEVVGALDVDLSGASLSSPGALTIPTDGGSAARVVVARMIAAGGQRAPQVVARAVLQGDKLVSTTAAPAVPAGVTLPGVRAGGRYLFVRLPEPFGYLTGAVTDGAGGAPASSARVSTDRLPFVDVTGADGRFVVLGAAGAGAAGANELIAASTVTDATGTAASALGAQDAAAEAAVAVASAQLAVAVVSPVSGASGIIASTPVSVTFTKPVAPASVTTSSFRLVTESGNPVLGSVTVLAGNRVASFTPASSLSGSTRYKVLVGAGVQDLYGKPMGAGFESSFTTAAVIHADDRLKQEQIRIGYPDAEGAATVTLPALSVPVGSVIVALNNTSGGTVTTVAGQGATTLKLFAQVGDEIVLMIRQPDGAEYRIAQAAYRRADGVTSVSENGGTVTSEDGGLVLAVPKGAITGQADIRMTPKTEADITAPRSGVMAETPVKGGVEIRAEGTFRNEKELHLELPAPAGMPEGERVAFMRPRKITRDGQEIEVWQPVTSGRVEGGKFKTNSPPFTGLVLVDLLSWCYVFAPVQKRIIFGSVKERETNAPVQGALVLLTHQNLDPKVTILAGSMLDFTNEHGGYAYFDFNPSFQEGINVTAIDDSSNRRGSTFAVPLTAEGSDGYVEGRYWQGVHGYLVAKGNIVLPRSVQESGFKPPPALAAFGRRQDVQNQEDDSLYKLNVTPLGSPVRVYVASNVPLTRLTGKLVQTGLEPKELVWTPDGPTTYYTDLKLSAEGSYTINATGATADDPRSTSTITYNFICLRNPNTRPPLEGAPKVLSITPADGSTDVDMTGDIRVEFSEPVRNLVAGETLYVEGPSGKHGGAVTSGGLEVKPDSANVSSIIFRPSPALVGGKDYCVQVTGGVVDDTGLALDSGAAAEGGAPLPVKSCFRTFQGLVLTPNPVADPGDRLAVAGQYAVTTYQESQGRFKLSVYDISEPHAPVRTGSLALPQWAWAVTVVEDHGLNVDGEVYSRFAVVTTSSPSPNQLTTPANLWVIDLRDVAAPRVAGVASLYLPIQEPALPHSVRVLGGRAYVGNITTRGVMAVDLAQAIRLFKNKRGRLPDAPDITPEAQAVMPMAGYAHAAKKQSVQFDKSLELSSSAIGVDAVTQSVLAPGFQGPKISGTMPVVYAADSVRKRLVTVGIPEHMDGLNRLVGPDHDTDDRVLDFAPLAPEGMPRSVRVVPNVLIPQRDASGRQTGSKQSDIAVVVGFQRLWLFDVTKNAAEQKIKAEQFPSKSFLELDPELAGNARNVEVEGTLAYAAFNDRVAVIDFSDPANPRVIAKINDLDLGYSSIAVKDGFVFTLSPENGGLRVSIARPATQVFVHGQSLSAAGGGAGLTCSNPVVIDRKTRAMRQKAEILFQVFGLNAAANVGVNIFKNDVQVASVPAAISPSSTERVVTGRAEWFSDTPIDLEASYSVQVGVNQGQASEFRSQRAAIPFSFLIAEYQGSIGFEGRAPVRNYGYVLGTNSQVTFEIDGRALVNEQRTFGLNVERVENPGLADGRYPFRLRAVSSDDGALSDEVAGIVEVTRVPEEMRRPGHTVVGDVDISTGSLGLTHTDLQVKNRGLSLAITRSYNSGAANLFSPFGYGWHYNYQVLLTYRKAERTYTVTGGDASVQQFSEDEVVDGGMKARAPFHGKLVKNADGSFDYFTKAHVKYHFPGALERDQFSYYNQAYIGNLEYIEDPNRNRITLDYDELGRVRKIIDPSESRALEFIYEEAETPYVGVIAPTVNVNNIRACARGEQFGVLRKGLAKAHVGRAWRVKEIKAPGGLRIEYEYDPDGNLKTVRRRGGDSISVATGDSVWNYEYKPDNSAQTSVDTRHLLKAAVNPNGRRTEYDYDLALLGLPVKAVRPPVADNKYGYELRSGKIIQASVTDGRGNATSYTFDEGGHNTGVRAPRGATYGFSFNERGLKTGETDPEGTRTEYTYDALGNETSRRVSGRGVSVTRTAVYDPQFSRMLSETDFNGKTTTYSIDGGGNVTGITLPTGRSIRMSYAGKGDLVSMTNERGLKTTLSYDQYGNPEAVTREVSPGNFVTVSTTYDERSRPTSSTDTVRANVTYSYDTHEHLVGQTTTDPAGFREAQRAVYVNKPMGHVMSMTVTGGRQSYSVSYDLDGLERPTQVVETAGGAGAFTLSRSYDGNSNLTSETDRRGVTTTYEYDPLNFLTGQTVTGPHGSAVSVSFERDLVGNATGHTDMYGQKTQVAYDGLRRETSRTFPGGYTEAYARDGNGNVLSFTDRNGGATAFAYDGVNRVLLRRDPLGRTETWAYEDDPTDRTTYVRSPQGLKVVTQTDGLGRPLLRQESFGANTYTTTYAYSGRDCTVTDPRGTVTRKEHSAFGDLGRLQVQGHDFREEMHYAAFGALLTRTDAKGRQTSYDVDSFNRATAASYPGGFAESWKHDGEGNLLEHTDARGVTSSMTYDNVGRPLSRKVGDVPVLTVRYDDSAPSETHLDAKSQPTVYRFDGLHRLTAVTNAEGRTRTQEYDGLYLLKQTDYKQQAVRFANDAAGRVTEVADRAGQVISVSYSDAGGTTKTAVDRRGHPRVESYDPLERLLSLSVGGQRVVAYEYDGNGNRTAQVDGRGNRVSYAFDPLDRLTQADHSGARVEKYGYDQVGNLTSYDDGRGGALGMTYDDADHLETRTDGEGHTTRFKFDGEGLLLERVAPKGGFKTSYEYNDLRSLEVMRDPRGGTWEFGYDLNQNLASVKDANGNTVAYGHDPMNRVRSVSQPLGVSLSYGYDANGNRTSVTDGKGQAATFGYDALDRQTSAAHPAAPGTVAVAYGFEYDPEGNVVGATESVGGAGSRSYARTYDARNRLRSATDAAGRRVDFDYDAADNLTSVRGADGKAAGYEYDSLNRLKTATLPGGATASFEWYADGLLRQVSYGSGMQRSYAYDNADRLLSVSNDLGSGQSEGFAYTYDANGNRESEARRRNGQVTRTLSYGYDGLDRLTSVAAQGAGVSASLAYTYDAAGNRKTEAGTDFSGLAVDHKYDYDALNRLTGASGYGGADLVYSYDNNGNLTGVTQAGLELSRFEYDARDQLRRVTDGAGAEVARYDYDFERRRTAKTAAGGPQVSYVYGAEGVINEFNPQGQLLSRYDFGADGVVRGELEGEGERWYFGDALGSTTALSAPAPGGGGAQPAAAYEYGPWGEVLAASGSGNAVGYTGQRLDAETGMMPLGNGERYYLPRLGRFAQEDAWLGQLEEGQSLNRYAYVVGNPLTYHDPSGNLPLKSWGKAAKAFGAGILKGAANVVMEPFREVVDVAVLVYGTQVLHLDGSEIEMDSALGKIQQRRVLEEGQSWQEAAARGVRDFSFNFASFGVYGFAGEQIDLNRQYRRGEITGEEYLVEASGSTGNFAGGFAVGALVVKGSKAANRRAAPELNAEGRGSPSSAPKPQAEGAADALSVSERVRAAVAESSRGREARSKSHFQEHLRRTRNLQAADEGATITIKKPSVFSDPALTAAERVLAEKAWTFKKSSLSRAAERGELKWTPKTKNIRVSKLQKDYRAAVAARFRRRFGRDPDFGIMNADHPVDMIVGGAADQGFKMIYGRVNKSVGASLEAAGKRAGLQPGDKVGRIIFEE